MIALDVTKDDLEKIDPLIQKNPIVPNVKLSIYKNRRGSYNRIFLWMHADKGTCRYEALYATDFNYEPVAIEDIKISVREEDLGNDAEEYDFDTISTKDQGANLVF